jgi:hypothetical protein
MRSLAPWLAALALFGCSPSSTDTPPPDLLPAPVPSDLGAAAPSVNATARAADTAVSAVLDVAADGADWVQASFTDENGLQHQTPSLPVTGASTAVPLFGLPAGANTTIDVTVGRSSDGATTTAPSVVVTTPDLPDEFPEIDVTTTGVQTHDAVVLSLLKLGGSTSWAAIVDRTGRLLWYRAGGPPSFLGFDVQRWPNGDLTVFQSATLSFEQLDFTDGVLQEWTVPTALGLDGHDAELLPNGHLLAFQRGTHTADTTPFVDGGVPDAAVYDVTVVELDGQNPPVPLWSSWPSIQLDETMPDISLTSTVDAIHPNSLVKLDNGDLLVSLRNTDSVLRIDGATGQIKWRMGGKKSDFQFVNDPFNGFSHQHYARYLANGDLLLLDNGDLHSPQVSRAVEYRVDETAHTATLVWEYRHSPDLDDTAAGSVQRLTGGDTLVSWGIDGVVTQVDPFGVVDWELTVDNNMVYRALSIDGLY